MQRSLIAFLLGVFALAGCASYSATPAAPPATPWAATPADCTTLVGEGDKPATLPTGAARITLCNEPGHEITQVTPPDALVTDTAAVVAAYNAGQRANLAVMACTADLGPAYRLVVEYPGDKVLTLRGELYGCRVVGDKTAAQAVLDAFTTALIEQRKDAPVTLEDPIGEASCGMGASVGSWLPGTMDATVAGFRCTDGVARAATIAAVDWATLRDDYTANATRTPLTEAEREQCRETIGTSLVGVTASGERVALHGRCGIFEHWTGFNDDSWTWRPGPAASAIIEAAG